MQSSYQDPTGPQDQDCGSAARLDNSDPQSQDYAFLWQTGTGLTICQNLKESKRALDGLSWRPSEGEWASCTGKGPKPPEGDAFDQDRKGV